MDDASRYQVICGSFSIRRPADTYVHAIHLCLGEIENSRDIRVWQPKAGPSRFSSAKITLHTDSHRADEASAAPTPGVLLHMVGDIPNSAFEPEPPHLQFELYLPQDLMEQLWTEAAHSLVAKATLHVKVEAFRSEVDRIFIDPWRDHTYCIENASCNTATFGSLSFEQSVVLPTRSANSESISGAATAATKADKALQTWLAKTEANGVFKDEKGRRVRYASAAVDAAKAVAAWFKQYDDPKDPDRVAYHLEYQPRRSG